MHQNDQIQQLHNSEISVGFFQFEGWNDFDERRRSKHQKQIEFRVGVSRDFDEGADKN
jgi:leucine-rich repeat protein SHOC2